jgi:hypothetical protein
MAVSVGSVQSGITTVITVSPSMSILLGWLDQGAGDGDGDGTERVTHAYILASASQENILFGR